MAPETESERLGRIRDAQINARGRSNRKPSSTTLKQSHAGTKQKSVVKAKVQNIAKLVTASRANTTANAVHDVLVGIAIAAIPAILALIFLPDGFKVVGILLLPVGGVVGYLLGETLA
jgi:hypothetical protein